MQVALDKNVPLKINCPLSLMMHGPPLIGTAFEWAVSFVSVREITKRFQPKAWFVSSHEVYTKNSGKVLCAVIRNRLIES